MSEMHDLVAPFALDALDASEREAFVEHIEECRGCQEELGRLQEASLHLAEQTSRVPPPHLKEKIMSSITGHGPEVGRIEQSRRHAWSWAFAAAAAVALLFAGLWIVVGNQRDRAESVAAVLAAEDAVAIGLASEVGAAEFVYSEALGFGVFLDRGLEEPTGDRIYELWLIDESGPRPAGLFRPDETAEPRILVEGILPGLVLAMTEEPAGGSDQPTGEILLSAEL